MPVMSAFAAPVRYGCFPAIIDVRQDSDNHPVLQPVQHRLRSENHQNLPAEDGNYPAKCRYPASFIIQAMVLRTRQDFFTSAGMGKHRNKIALRAGTDKQTCFFSEQICDLSFSLLASGSSPYTSSPTSAVAITSRMASSGMVTVSLLKSIISYIIPDGMTQ